MFSRLVHSIGHIVSPQATRPEVFRSHCEGAIACIRDKPADVNALQLHCSAIIALLNEEEESFQDRSDGDEPVGPCAEYLFTEPLVEILCEACALNDPVDAREAVLKMMSTLLRVFRATLIPHEGIHRPLLSLVKTCVGMVRQYLENMNRRKDANDVAYLLSNAFNESKEGANMNNSDNMNVMNELEVSKRDMDAALDFIEALSGRIAERPLNFHFFLLNSDENMDPLDKFPLLGATLPLLDAAGPTADRARAAILHLVSLQVDEAAEMLVEAGLVDLLVSNIRSTYGRLSCIGPGNVQTGTSDDSLLGAYHTVLSFINSVVRDSHPIIGDALTTAFSEHFLNSILLTDMKGPAEGTATTGFDRCRELVSTFDPPLLDCVVSFLLSNGPVKTMLLRNIGSMSTDLCVASLQLLYTLLSLGEYTVINGLLDHLCENSNARRNEGSAEEIMGLFSFDTHPTEIPFTYLQDAQNQCAFYLNQTDSWAGSIPNETDNNESPFLSLLFDTLENAIENPFEVNVALTGIFSIVSCLPFSMLRHALFCSEYTESSGSENRSLVSILKQLSIEANSRAENVPRFAEKLSNVRSILQAGEGHGSRAYSTAPEDLDGAEQGRFLQACVVLSEFTMELAAISVTSDQLMEPDEKSSSSGSAFEEEKAI